MTSLCAPHERVGSGGETNSYLPPYVNLPSFTNESVHTLLLDMSTGHEQRILVQGRDYLSNGSVVRGGERSGKIEKRMESVRL